MENEVSKDTLRACILDEIDDVSYRRHVLPHSGLLPDYFEHYWDLAELVSVYFDEPFYKPQRSTQDQVK